jgi:SAM-dependent methyltransferase
MNIKDRLVHTKRRVLENIFFRPTWYSIALNPYFINRRSLYLAVQKFAKLTTPESSVLDVGCGLKPYRDLFPAQKYVGIDIETGGHSNDQKHVDSYYDGEHIPFDDRSFDFVLCTQVLEHAEKPEKLIEECARVLKPGGKVLFSMPFMYPEHEIPYDFQRYTRFKHTSLLQKNGFGQVETEKTTGFFGTFSQLFSVFIFESIRFRASILKTLLSIFILMPIQALGLALDFIFRKSGPTMDYVITAQKNGIQS